MATGLYPGDKAINSLMKHAIRHGATLRQGPHIVLCLPNGTIQSIPRTPSDPRALTNCRKELERKLRIAGMLSNER